ncbi:hypothetical protein [Roseobacter sp. N2S]|nr:hypothetical protein [Roseobacter sp. N2S]MDR6266526.1 hypothetical protein [Roseobacter sp. N2S]
MRDWLSLQCLKLAAKLTIYGDPYDKITEAIEVQKLFCRPPTDTGPAGE